MSERERVSGSAATTSGDYAEAYYASYAGHGDYDWDTPEWRDFFLQAAVRIKATTNPRTTLDVGCAKGLLVQALATIGVDSAGIDVSEHAIANAHADVRDRLQVASATRPITARYDLVTCIEVLEHLSPADAQLAIDNICAVTDVVLFTTTPGHFDDPTHVNVRPTAEWVAWFAERGFYRRTDVNVDFLATWGVLVERQHVLARDLVHRYEAQFAVVNAEAIEKRTALLEAHREIGRLRSGGGSPADVARLQEQVAENEKVRHALQEQLVSAQQDVLTTRDHIIGLEATAENAARRLAVLKMRLHKQQTRATDLQKRLDDQRRRAEASERRLDEMSRSRSWRLGRALTRPFRSAR